METRVTSPQSIEELMARADQLSGKSLGELASSIFQPVPYSLHRHKGWIGQLIESILGADASNLAEPDFQKLGVELKTIPINKQGNPSESTYVCTAPLLDLIDQVWETSTVKKKLARVLWVPIEGQKGSSISERRVGAPLLWELGAEEEHGLRQDWEEFAELISLGQAQSIRAHLGNHLQIRPKAAHSRVQCDGYNEEGLKVKMNPRGFYLRASFINKILKQHYNTNLRIS